MIWLLLIAHLCLVDATVYDVTTIYRLLEFPVRENEAPIREGDTAMWNEPLRNWDKVGWSNADSGNFGVTFPNTVRHELASEANNFSQKMALTSDIFDVIVQPVVQTVTFIFSTKELDSIADLIVLKLSYTIDTSYLNYNSRHYTENRQAYRCIKGQMGPILNLPDGSERNCDLVSNIDVERMVTNFENVDQFRIALNLNQLHLQIFRNGFSNTTVFDLQNVIQLKDMAFLKVMAKGKIILSKAVLSLTEKLGTLLSPTNYLTTAAICVIVTGYMDPRSGASLVVSAEYETKPSVKLGIEYETKPSVKLGVITAATNNVTLNTENKAMIRDNAESWKIVHFVDPGKEQDFKIRLTVDKLHDFPVLIRDVSLCHEEVQVELHARTNARGLPFLLNNGTILEPNAGFDFPTCNIYYGECSWTVQNMQSSAITNSSYLDVGTMSIKSDFSEDGITDSKEFSGTLFASVDAVKTDSDFTSASIMILLIQMYTNTFYYISVFANDDRNENPIITIMKCENTFYGGNIWLPDGSKADCTDFLHGKKTLERLPTAEESSSLKAQMDLSVHATEGYLIIKINGVRVVNQHFPEYDQITNYKIGVKDLIGSITTSSMMAYTLGKDIGTMVSPVVELSSSKLCVVVDYYVEDEVNSTVDVTLSSVASDVTQENFMQNVNRSTTRRMLPSVLKEESWRQDMILFQVPNDEMHKHAHITLTTTRGRKNTKVKIQRIAGCNADEEEDVRIFSFSEKSLNESPSYDVAVKDRRPPTGQLIKSPAGFYGSEYESGQLPGSLCLNGGIKDSNEANCICPAGFYGIVCESGCGANSYGADCGGRCSATDRECRGLLLCRPLVGCACAPGLSGPRCDTPCLNGFYGSDCAQTCGNCSDIIDGEQTCDSYSGECRHGCKPGFYAPLCKEKYTHLSSEPVVVYEKSDFRVIFNLTSQKGRSTPMFFQIQTRRRTPVLTLLTDQSQSETPNSNKYDWQSTTPELISEVISAESTLIWRNISGLKPGRLYQLRVIFIDQDGGRYEGEDVPAVDIRTNCSVPVRANLVPYVLNKTEDSITIRWNDVEEVDDWCPAEKNEVHVKIGWQWIVRQYEPHVLQDTFQHLLPGRSYQVKLRVITATGATGFTDTLVATTSNALVLGRVGGLSMTSVSEDKITVQWTPPSNTQATSRSTYRVMYECIRHLACDTTDCSNSSGQLDTTSTFASLPHLLPFSRYNITVFALSASPGVPSSIQTATDRSAPSVSPTVSSKPVVSRSNSSIAFEWNAPASCSGINGYLRGYHCQLFVEGKSEPVTEMSTKTTTATFDGLAPHTEYTVKIYATTSSGWNVNYPLTITGKTRATTPAVVQDLTAYKRGRRMLGLRWSKPNLTYGTLSSFTLTTKHAADEEPISVRVEAKPCPAWPEQYCHTLKNLQQDQEYDISVQARNTEVEEDGDATSVKATTKEGAPSAPSYLKLMKLTDTSATIEWGIPYLINGQLRSFLINIEETDSVNASDCCENFPMREVLVKTEGKSYHFELTDMRPASTYMVSVTAKTVALGPSVSRTVNTRPPTPTMLTAPRLATPIDHDTPTYDDTPTGQDKPIRVVMSPAKQYQDMISGYLLLLASNGTSDASAEIYDTWLSQELSKISPTLFLAAERTKDQLDGDAIVELARDGEAKKGRFGVVSVDSLSAGIYELVQVVVLDYCGSLNLAYVRGNNVIIN